MITSGSIRSTRKGMCKPALCLREAAVDETWPILRRQVGRPRWSSLDQATAQSLRLLPHDQASTPICLL